jgi:hypothetical protein
MQEGETFFEKESHSLGFPDIHKGRFRGALEARKGRVRGILDFIVYN